MRAISAVAESSVIVLYCIHWRSQGAVAAVAPLGLDSDKNYCCISISYYITITFFFIREAFCGLENAENCIFGRGFAPDPLGELTTPWSAGERTPLPRLHPTRRKRLDPPLHIISGYATDCIVLFCIRIQTQ